jgi:hypothetical protein
MAREALDWADKFTIGAGKKSEEAKTSSEDAKKQADHALVLRGESRKFRELSLGRTDTR